MGSVVHPGPVRATRLDLVSCKGRQLEVMLAPGIALEDSVAQALAPQGIDSAWLEIVDTEVSRLAYVIPAHAPNREQAAWYSDVRSIGAGRIERLGMIVGTYNGASFLHGHGTWAAENGTQSMGHILAPQTELAQPVLARGIGLSGARFDRRLDAETRFELFHVDRVAADDQELSVAEEFAALRLLPNQDFTQAIDQACHSLAWSSARVHGLGSLIGATFADGRVLDSLPTEFLVTDAVAGLQESTPEIIIVGVNGSKKIMKGYLSRGENAVLVTAELILERLN